MRVLEGIVQGTPAWHEARSTRFNASEAPIVMGVSKHRSRQALVREKALGLTEEVSPATQERFDRGHRAEAAARVILEERIGEPLYPVTVVSDDDKLLASLDGATMLFDTLYECKLWNEELAAEVRSGELHPHYCFQMEQQLYITRAEKVIFVCSDETGEKFISMEYRPVPGRMEQLLAAWEQFDADVKSYVHKAVPDQVVAAEQPALPVVIVKTEGQIAIRDNLTEFGVALRSFIATIPKKPATDQEFADKRAANKTLRKVVEVLQDEKRRALAGIADVERINRVLDELSELARTEALAGEKEVTKRETEIRSEIAVEFRAKLTEHVKGLNASLCAGLLVFPDADWPGAMKGKKTVQGLRDGCDGLLAKEKIAVNERASVIRANLDAIDAADQPYLFADRATLAMKDGEAVKAIVAGRLAEEVRRVQAQKDAAEKAAREKLEREAEEARKREAQAAQPAPVAPAPTAAAQPAPTPAVTGTVTYMRPSAPARPMVTGSGIPSGVQIDERSQRVAVLERLHRVLDTMDLDDLLQVERAINDLIEA